MTPRAGADRGANVDCVSGPDNSGPGIGDGLRRAHMAAERTYLAWWRTALATAAMAIAVGQLLPDAIGTSTTWPYVAVGVGWGVLALAIAAYTPIRQLSLRRAIDRGEYAHPHAAALAVLGAGGTLLVAGTVLLVVVGL